MTDIAISTDGSRPSSVSRQRTQAELSRIWQQFNASGSYRAKLGYLKKYRNDAQVLDHIRDQTFDMNNRVSGAHNENIINNILVVAKLARDRTFIGRRLGSNTEDKKALDTLVSVLSYMTPRKDFVNFAKKTMKKVARLRTSYAKTTLKNIASKFSNKLEIVDYAKELRRGMKMSIDSTSAGRANEWRLRAEALSQSLERVGRNMI